MSTHYPLPIKPKGDVRPCVEGGEKCPRGCGATLKSEIDKQIHVCDAVIMVRARNEGWFKDGW